DRIRNDEVSVCESLHQGACSKPICAVIREISFTYRVKAWNCRHQVVVDPQAAHCVVDRRIDSHRSFVRIFTGDPFVHVEQISVSFGNHLLAEALNRVLKIQVDTQAASNTTSFIAYCFRIARCDVAGNQISEAWIFPFEVIVALRFRYLTWRPRVPGLLRNPD